ncbi:MAG: Gfo/Idh/MocA family oxidoreductase, partial [Pirellulaceae bacterium]|nr:Gfo/Idh/MocA family oxidoreductase [Pirellulaceae bacterium]
MSDARYNVAVIGCGRIAREHVAGYEKNGDRFAIKAFVSRDRSRAADFVRQYGTGTSYASLA